RTGMRIGAGLRYPGNRRTYYIHNTKDEGALFFRLFNSHQGIGGFTTLRYRNSDAYSTSTGTRHNSSKIYSASKPACQLVPQAMIIMRWAFLSCSILFSTPAMVMVPLAASTRPRKQSNTVL